jgi:hypothetical protein
MTVRREPPHRRSFALTAPLVAVAWSLLVQVPALAKPQEGSSDAVPVSIKAEPEYVWTRGTVLLRGTVTGAVPVTGVGIKVLTPARPPAAAHWVTLAPSLAPDGVFQVAFDQTPIAGVYKIALTTPNQLSATGEFKVIGSVKDSPPLPDPLPQVVEVVGKVVAIAQRKVELVPPSPAKDRFKAKLNAAAKQVAELRENANAASQAIRGLTELVDQAGPDDQKLAGDRDRMLGTLSQAQESVDLAPDELRHLELMQATCDNLDVVVEGFKWTSVLLNLGAGSVSGIAASFGKDLSAYLTSTAAGAGGARGDQAFLVGETTKYLDMINDFDGKKTNLVGILNDVMGQAAQDVMNAYCVQFVGPVKAHMKAQFFQNGRKWWEYEFDLTGRIMVHYPKDATCCSIALNGRLEGYGNNFKVWENALTVLYPKLMSSTVKRTFDIPPPELTAIGAKIGSQYIEGSVFNAKLLPNSFYFAVDGTLERDRMILHVGAVRTDMSPKARGIALMLPVLSLAPTIVIYELPYKDAHFVFERASEKYVIPIRTQGDVMTGTQHFSNERGNSVAKGDYSVDIKLCNPGC